jgi:hypothetical protein
MRGGIVMFDWSGTVKGYQIFGGYNTLGGVRAEFNIDGFDESASGGSREATIIVRFADLEIASGATFGTVSTDSDTGNISIRAELPMDWFQTFWRSIDHIQNQDGLLVVKANDQNEVIKVGFSVWKSAEGLEDHSRRERLDTFMQQLVVCL